MAFKQCYSKHHLPRYEEFNTPDDVIFEDENHSTETERAAKRRRIDLYAENYLRGVPVVLQSTSLKGPFDGWNNPWKSTVRLHSERFSEQHVVYSVRQKEHYGSKSPSAGEDDVTGAQRHLPASATMCRTGNRDARHKMLDLKSTVTVGSRTRLPRGAGRGSDDSCESWLKNKGLNSRTPREHSKGRKPSPETLTRFRPPARHRSSRQSSKSVSRASVKAPVLIVPEQTLVSRALVDQARDRALPDHALDSGSDMERSSTSSDSDDGWEGCLLEDSEGAPSSPLSPMHDDVMRDNYREEATSIHDGRISLATIAASGLSFLASQERNLLFSAVSVPSNDDQPTNAIEKAFGRHTTEQIQADLFSTRKPATQAEAATNRALAEPQIPPGHSIAEHFETAASRMDLEHSLSSVYDLPPTPDSERFSSRYAASLSSAVPHAVAPQPGLGSAPEHQDSRAYSTLNLQSSESDAQLDGASPKLVRLSDIRSPQRGQRSITEFTKSQNKSSASSALNPSSENLTRLASRSLLRSWTISKPKSQADGLNTAAKASVSFDENSVLRHSSAPTPPSEDENTAPSHVIDGPKSCLKKDLATSHANHLHSHPPSISFIRSVTQASNAESCHVPAVATEQMGQQMFPSLPGHVQSVAGNAQSDTQMEAVLNSMVTFLDDEWTL